MRSAKVRLEDIAEALQGIEHALSGVGLHEFAESWTLQRAVERALEIISEASRGVPDESKARHSDVPWPQIAAIGNILRHEYHRVEPLLIWNITQEHLPALAGAVSHMLQDPE